MLKVILLVSVIFLFHLTNSQNVTDRSFVIDYDNNQFLMDGQPFRYVSGEMHYFRTPHQYWSDRLNKMKAAGLNVVQTDIPWFQHEPTYGSYDFNGNLDFTSFINLANSTGFYVIVRAGPYIDCATDMGGLPSWLLQKDQSIKLRTSDSSFLQYVDIWLNVLLPMIKPLLYENGGPVISIQIENEYGSYPSCEPNYMPYLQSRFRELLGDTVVLFTTDEATNSTLQCGSTPGLYTTVDFQPWDDVDAAFELQRLYEPQGPLVNSQYCPGWDDFWGYGHSNIPTDEIVATLDKILAKNASVNMYMFTGGTSFAFINGALDNPFISPTTSYDFTAPISEAGDTSDKYLAIRDVISKYFPIPVDPIPDNITKYAYGSVSVNSMGSFFDLLPLISQLPPTVSQWPQSFEELEQTNGYVLYEAVIKSQLMQPAYLSVPNLSDRGYVFIDKVYAGILSRTDQITQMPIRISQNQSLQILVENQGHVDYGSDQNDFKGIYGSNSVSIGNEYLSDWTMTKILLSEITSTKVRNSMAGKKVSADDRPIVYPAAFSGNLFVTNSAEQPMDTFLDLSGWSKGIAFINGWNLGRYWPVVGPQVTLFVPKYYLNPYPDANNIVIFEQESSPCATGIDSCTVEFIDYPILAAPTPYNATNFAY